MRIQEAQKYTDPTDPDPEHLISADAFTPFFVSDSRNSMMKQVVLVLYGTKHRIKEQVLPFSALCEIPFAVLCDFIVQYYFLSFSEALFLQVV
jgi:hypothetical protein